MKITLLVNYDLPSLLALNYLAPSLQQHQVVVFYTHKPSESLTTELSELAKFDSKQISASSYLKSFKAFEASQLNYINTSDYQLFEQTKPDLVISIRHMSILRSKVINTPKLGVINLHSGLLPEYQGVMATFWALLNKQREIGTTLHYIEDSTIDTGSIISKSIVAADYQRSYFWNVLNIYKAGCDNISLAIETLDVEKALHSKPQSGDANYYSFPTPEDIANCSVVLFSNNDSAELLI